jgi:FlaA1/EpsC-like NDP-sugar epimerase
MSDNGINKMSTTANGTGPIVDQLEALRRIAKETIYQTRNYNQVYLSSGEIPQLFAERLLNGGDFTFTEQAVIFMNISEAANHIISTVNGATSARKYSRQLAKEN